MESLEGDLERELCDALILFWLFPNTDFADTCGVFPPHKRSFPSSVTEIVKWFLWTVSQKLWLVLWHKCRGFYFPHRLLTWLACSVSAYPNQQVFPALVLLCALVLLTALYVLPCQLWVSHYPPKDQGFHQCVVYNWDCRKVHIVNYTKMQVTVQVNCNFSQYDVFIRGFFPYHYEG